MSDWRETVRRVARNDPEVKKLIFSGMPREELHEGGVLCVSASVALASARLAYDRR